MQHVPPKDVVYGIHPVEELLARRIGEVDRVYIDGERKSAQLFALVKLCRKERLHYQFVPGSRLNEVAGTEKHQGITAVCSVRPYTTVEELRRTIQLAKAPLLFLAASVEDPRNLGSLIRSCAAFGVDALLLERKSTAPLNATVAKASAGMIEHLPIVKPRNLEGLVADLASQGFRVIGAQAGATKLPADLDLTGPVIFVTGGESRGIPPYLAKTCTDIVGIPMQSQAESLNVSVAGAILLYECDRQRRRAAPSSGI